MSPFSPVDFYCERTEPGWFAEPLNALTNLAFIVMAYALWRQFRATSARRTARVIAILLALVGVGSLSLHTIAVGLTALLDVLGIAAFILTFVWLYLRRVVGWGEWACVGAIVVYLISSAAAGRFAGPSASYAPAWLLLVVMAVLGLRAGSPTWGWLIGGAALFVPSVVFRALDHHWCDTLPRGTHFMWHICNAGVLYLAGRGLVGHLVRSDALLEPEPEAVLDA